MQKKIARKKQNMQNFKKRFSNALPTIERSKNKPHIVDRSAR